MIVSALVLVLVLGTEAQNATVAKGTVAVTKAPANKQTAVNTNSKTQNHPYDNHWLSNKKYFRTCT